jgi:hypothetical protein
MLGLEGGGGKDPRADIRSNVFLSATLAAPGGTLPVRIRNISPTGALLDGAALPPEGAPIHLRRGSLTVDGEVVWQKKGLCGLRFAAEVIVNDWVRRTEHKGQARVDEMIAIVRSAPKALGGPARAQESDDSLQSISADLTKSCERLANLPDVVAMCSAEILRLDAIAQRLTNFVEATEKADDGHSNSSAGGAP